MAISAEDKNFLVSLYVGYFNRAPDPAGLQFWIDQVEAGRDTNTIAADFAASPEAKSLYPFLTTPDVSSPTSFITAVYANLFNRAPDAAGQAFWEAQLSSGAVSPADAIDAIIKGATTAPDSTILANKNAVGLDFATDAGNTPGFTFDLNGSSGSAAKSAISGVTEDASTVVAAQAATDAYLNGVAGAGETFTLTTSVDAGPAFAGTNGNDTFIAIQDGVNDTYTTGDSISGGTGTDRLNLTITNNAANPLVDMADIENVFIRATVAETVEASGWTGVQQVWNDRSTDDLTIEGLQELATVGVVKGAGTEYNVSFDVDLTGDADAVTVATTDADLAVLGLEGSNNDEDFEVVNFVNTGESEISAIEDVTDGAALTPSEINVSGAGTLDLDGTTYAGLTTVTSADVAIEVAVDNSGEDVGTDTTITSTGGDDVVTVVAAEGGATLASDAAVTTIDLGDGDNTVTFDGGGDLQQASITTGAGDDTIDAEMDSGELKGSTLSISAGAGNDTIRSQLEDDAQETIDAGDGDDSVNLTGNEDLTGTDNTDNSVDGGAGFDVLGLRSQDAADVNGNVAMQSVFAGFEALRVTNDLAHDFSLSSFGADVNELQLDGDVTGTSTVSGFTSGGTVEIRADADMTGTLAVGMTDATDANTPNDTLNVELNADINSGDNHAVNLSVDGINIVNVDAIDSSATVAAATGKADTSETDQADGYVLNLSNEENVSKISITGDRAVSYTASVEATALGNVDGSAAEGDLDIDLALFSGTEGVTVTTGAGDDMLVGSGLSDVLVGGAGDDNLRGDKVTVTTTATAQQTVFTIVNGEDGDTFTIGSTTLTYGTATETDVVNALEAEIGGGVNAVVTTQGGDATGLNGTYTVTGQADGTAFAIPALDNSNVQPSADAQTLTLTGDFDAGEYVEFSIDGTAYAVDVGGQALNTAATSVATFIDGLTGFSASANAGVVTVTGPLATSYTLAAVGVDNDATTGDALNQTAATADIEVVSTTGLAAGDVVDFSVQGEAFQFVANGTPANDYATIANLINSNATLAAAGVSAAVNVGTTAVNVTDAQGQDVNFSGSVTGAGTISVTENGTGASQVGVTVTNNTVTAADPQPDAQSLGTNDQDISASTTVVGQMEVVVGGQTSDSLTGGEGSDTFNFVAGDSTEAAMDVITDFEAGAANADFDTLNLDSTTVASDVLLASQIDVAANSADATASTDIGAIIENGMIKLVGADAAEIDTLAEWIDVAEDALSLAEVGAFEFDGSTYVVEEGSNIIKLDGTVDIVGISTTEDSNVIHIA